MLNHLHLFLLKNPKIRVRKKVNTLELALVELVFVLLICSSPRLIGQSTFVEVVVDGNPFPKVIWYKGKIEIAEGVKFKTEIDPTTGIATLHIAKCRQTDDSPYAVTAHNEHGEVHAEFHLYVKGIRNRIRLMTKQI